MTDGPIVVIDYGAGNLRSVARALAHAGEEPIVTANPRLLEQAAGLVLPGVGAAQDTMTNLEARGLVEPLRKLVGGGLPLLGVCMGLQALFDWSDEGEGQVCLGILPGKIRHFGQAGAEFKIPHMGWNTVRWIREHPVTEGIPDGSYFYFVHSFYPEPAHGDVVLGETEYGNPFASVVAKDNVVATQFHPEKSGEIGLRFYGNFCRWVRSASGTAATLQA